MKTLQISMLTLLLLTGFLNVVEYRESRYDIEQKAMNSLGYKIVTRSAAYPEDRFAMPEPYSSEQLVTYAIHIQEYKPILATNNFNKD